MSKKIGIVIIILILLILTGIFIKTCFSPKTRANELEEIKRSIEELYSDEVERLNYANQLVKDGVITDEEREEMFGEIMGNYLFDEDGFISNTNSQLEEIKQKMTAMSEQERDDFINELKNNGILTDEQISELLK